jgi:predicted CopG family antitoxin
MASKSKMIAISERTYHNLAQMGTLEDTFDSVINRMIQREKAAMSGPTLAGTVQNTAAALLSAGTKAKGAAESSDK